MERRMVQIPLRSSGEAGAFVEIALDDTFPADPSDLVDVLAGEYASPSLWLRLALEYLRRGRPAQMEQLLLEAVQRAPAATEEERSALVMVHATLVTLYTAESTTDRKRRVELHRKATTELSNAESLNPRDWNHWFVKGLLLLSKGDLEMAMKQFKGVLDPDVMPSHTGAMLGKACVHFARGEFRECRDLLRCALETNPSCPPSARIGLAHTYFRMGKPDLAQQWLKRVLEVDPTNVEAMAALAVLEINAGHIQPAMQQLKEAYHVNQRHPVVLNHLANHFFYKGEVQRALELATSAVDATNIEKLRAESYYIIARSHHALGAYDAAMKFYNYSTLSWPEFPLAQYGLGQMHIHKGELEKAVACFEDVLKRVPGNYESMRVLGSLYLQLGRRPQALRYLREITQDPATAGDPHAWAELAHLALVGGDGDAPDFTTALRHYDRARQQLRESSERIPPEYHNNAGVAQFYLGRLEEAEKAFGDAIEATGTPLEAFAPDCVTPAFNLGRVYEATCRLVLAEELYKGILKEHPTYVSCYVRLCMMAREKSMLSEAAEWLKLVFTVNKTHKDTWSMLGVLHLDKGEWLPAQKKFEKVMELAEADVPNPPTSAEEEKRKDPFAQIALGSVFHAAMRREHDPQKSAKFLRHAYEFFKSALKSDPSNAYAALGVGVVLAEHGEHMEAERVFEDLRITLPNALEPAVNCAHAKMRVGKADEALRLYQDCLRRWRWSPGDGQQLLLYVANAHFALRQWKECRTALQQALLVAPQNQTLWHALANLLEASASAELELQTKTAAGLSAAASELRLARSLFSWQKKESHVEACSRKEAMATSLVEPTARREAEEHEARTIETRRRAEGIERRRAEQEAREREVQERERGLMEQAARIKAETQSDVIMRLQEEAAKKAAAAAAKLEAENNAGGEEEEAAPASETPAPEGDDAAALFGEDDNEAAAASASPAPKKKKHKRKHSDDEAGTPRSSGDESAHKRAKKEKKLRKKRKQAEAEAAAAAAAAAQANGEAAPASPEEAPTHTLSRLRRADAGQAAQEDAPAPVQMQQEEPATEWHQETAPAVALQPPQPQPQQLQEPSYGAQLEGVIGVNPASVLGAPPSALL